MTKISLSLSSNSELLKEFKQRIEQGKIIITRPDEQKAELMIYSQDGKYGLKVCCTEEGIKVN